MADEQHTSGFQAGPGRRGVVGALLIIALLALAVVLVILGNRSPQGDPGELAETSRSLPADVPLPILVDATAQWGLSDFSIGATQQDRMAGGAAIADIDADGVPELIVANGQVAVLSWNGSGYDPARVLGIADAIAVSTADVDLDGFQDMLVATSDNADYVVWGGAWLDGGSQPEQTELAATGQSSGLLAGELSGDGLIDIVRLGRGAMGVSQPDVLWTAISPRSFTPVELPLAERISLAGELFDADGDGLLDIWITRDVGWARGGDTVLSRRGDPTGEWVDIASDLGVELEVDGMGLTLADIDGDARIDVYVSDLGDNELLLGSTDGFERVTDRGAAHIRPVGASSDMVSSSWGSGALDINLDGVLDLVVASGGFPVGTVLNKIDDTDIALEEPPAVLIGVGDGTFVDVWASLGVDLAVVGRGLSVGDLDQDGDDDVVIVERRGTIHVLRNDTLGPTVTLVPPPDNGCSANRAVMVVTDAGTFQRLGAPHGYASSHQAQVIVGNPTAGPFKVGTGIAEELSGPFEVDEERSQTVMQAFCL